MAKIVKTNKDNKVSKKRVKGGIAKIVTIAVLIIFALAIAFVAGRGFQDASTNTASSTKTGVDNTISTTSNRTNGIVTNANK